MSRFSFSYQDTKATEDASFSDSVVYTLSVTTDISVSESASVTKYPVEDGSSVVDNFIVDNRVINFNGLITDIQVFGKDDNIGVEQWITDIRALRKAKTLLTVNVHALESIPNCVITSFDLNRNSEHGLSGWACKLAFTEVDISERAKAVEVKIPKAEVKNKVGGKNTNGDSSNKDVVLDTSYLAGD